MHGLLLWVLGCEPHPKQQTAAARVHYGDGSDDKCGGRSYGHVRFGARGQRRSNGWVRLALGSVLSTGQHSDASGSGCGRGGTMDGGSKLSCVAVLVLEGELDCGERGERRRTSQGVGREARWARGSFCTGELTTAISGHQR